MIQRVNKILGTMAVLSLGGGLAFLTGCHDDCDKCDNNRVEASSADDVEVPVNASYESRTYRNNDRADYEARRLHESMYEPRRAESESVAGQEATILYGDRRWLSDVEIQSRRNRLQEIEGEIALYPDRADRLNVEANVIRDEVRTSRARPQQPANGQATNGQPNQTQGTLRNETIGAGAPAGASIPGANSSAIPSAAAQGNQAQVPSTGGTPTPGLQPTNVTPSQTQTGEAASTVTTPNGEKVTTPLANNPSPNTVQPNPAQPSGTLNSQPTSGLRPATPGTQPSTGAQPSSGIINPSGPAGASSAPASSGTGGGTTGGGTGGAGGAAR